MEILQKNFLHIFLNNNTPEEFAFPEVIGDGFNLIPFDFNNDNQKKRKNINGISEKLINKISCYYAKFENGEKICNIREFQNIILKRQYLTESLLCFLTYQILNDLKYWNKFKIVHFDIKPENIEIDNILNIKIIDFSLSLDYSEINSNRIKIPFRGTNFYMAPEVLSNKIVYLNNLHKIDLYSLGVTIFNLAFNSYPYGLQDEDIGVNQEYSKILKKIENENLEFNNEANSYSSHFIDFLKRLLEKDINKRANINEALEHYWIKGAKILNDEKENLYCPNKFLDCLISDSLMNFNLYINK